MREGTDTHATSRRVAGCGSWSSSARRAGRSSGPGTDQGTGGQVPGFWRFGATVRGAAETGLNVNNGYLTAAGYLNDVLGGVEIAGEKYRIELKLFDDASQREVTDARRPSRPTRIGCWHRPPGIGPDAAGDPGKSGGGQALCHQRFGVMRFSAMHCPRTKDPATCSIAKTAKGIGRILLANNEVRHGGLTGQWRHQGWTT